MQRFLVKTRKYCNLIKLQQNNPKTNQKLDFKVLKFASKVPLDPIEQKFPDTQLNEITIGPITIQLLERLALVDLDSKEALLTLKESIQFADKIKNINTESLAPLYTVLEDQQLFLRDDEVSEGNCKEKILSNAKLTDEGYFVSPPGNIPLEQIEKNFQSKQ